jgi:D-aspartate ligase
VATRPPAIVIGLDSITGLQTARILASRGVPVIALAKDPKHYCSRTRVCERVLRADTDGEELVATLAALGPGLAEKGVLFPCSDGAVAQVSRGRRRLAAWYHLALPAHETVELLMDKGSFAVYARDRGLPIPPTFLLRSRDDAERAAESLSYPAVLKPSIRKPEWDRNSKQKAFTVTDGAELLALYDRTAAWADVLVAQQWIRGTVRDHYTCNCYLDAESRPLVTFVTRKLRQWPPETGIGSLGEEARNDTVLSETLRLFEGARFHGLAYLEMKRDPQTGEHHIIEPNVGRPTGRSATAEAGGVELLYTMYCDVAGLPLPPDRTQRYRGTKWIYARTDLQSALHDWRRGELTLGEWRRSLRGPKVDAVLSLRDPAPFAFDLWRAARLLAGGLRS